LRYEGMFKPHNNNAKRPKRQGFDIRRG